MPFLVSSGLSCNLRYGNTSLLSLAVQGWQSLSYTIGRETYCCSRHVLPKKTPKPAPPPLHTAAGSGPKCPPSERHISHTFHNAHLSTRSSAFLTLLHTRNRIDKKLYRRNSSMSASQGNGYQPPSNVQLDLQIARNITALEARLQQLITANANADIARENSVTALATDVDLGYIVLCGALVFFMQAGFGVLEAGAIARKNVINILFKVLSATCAHGTPSFTSPPSLATCRLRPAMLMFGAARSSVSAQVLFTTFMSPASL